MPCQDSAVALNRQPTAPMAMGAQLSLHRLNTKAHSDMLRPRVAIIMRGETSVLPTHPQTMRPGTATAVATEKAMPAAIEIGRAHV